MTKSWFVAALVLPLAAAAQGKEVWFGPAWMVLRNGHTLAVEAHRIAGEQVLLRRDGELYSLQLRQVAEIVETAESPSRPPGDEVRVYAPVRVPHRRRSPSEEASWRVRVGPLLRRQASLEARRDTAMGRLREAERELRRAGLLGRAREVETHRTALERAARELARLEEALAALGAELQHLREQARRSGAHPGWTR